MFVAVMLTMAVTGFAISAINGAAPGINLPSAALTFYLVVTSLMTVQRERMPWLERAAMVMGFGIAAGCLVLALVSINKGGAASGMAYPLVLFGAVACGAAVGDLRVWRGDPPKGAARLKRHLWRMCFAMFVASIAFFLGPDRLPAGLRIPALRAAGVLLPLAAIGYWKFKLRPRGVARTTIHLAGEAV
ncbi:MAG: hypothetical protein ABI665_12585 [Vicinamibacterales bacterium]